MRHTWKKDTSFKPDQIVKNRAVCLVCGCIIYKLSFRHFDRQITSYNYVLNDEVLDIVPGCTQKELFK